ncbi:hypothetical protein [Sphingopyxis terrae]|uniref:hypothetical protein n=1 Tax=Sphingopyxis terrae TaxID=33052 RepID=UPI0007899332|nr:hypothetical protein [Sphingopyxis terrae]
MAKPAKTKAPAYEQRLILFLDFLAFKEVVAETERDATALERLVAALDEVGQTVEPGLSKSERVTQFSDSLVLSYKVEETSAVFWMIDAIARTVVLLADRGYLLRGAVTVGKLLHDKRHIVGPAMVKAYELESRTACFPRVIVDREVLRMARTYRQPQHSGPQEERYVRSFLDEDKDGWLFIDYLSWDKVVEAMGCEHDAYPDYLGRMARLIRKGLKHADPRVARKYLWLRKRYLKAMKPYRDLPANKVNDPDFCAAIDALPRMRKRARKARKRVKAFDAKAAA